MKANQLLMQNLLDVEPRTGLIELNHKRMTLVSVEALGLLRRDLVDTLSMDRAKGFLMRYGWACGFQGAENLKKNFEWESIKELLLAGPVLHTIEGVVTVEPDELIYDEDYLYFSGYWRNSYEVEEHIHHFGKNDEAVCWTLVGYASGYLTNVFGKDVYVYEDKCKGKGDDYCYFVAQTVDSLDESYQDELRYYQSESLASELDRSYKKIQKLNEDIIKADKVHKQLVNLLLKGEGLSRIISFLSKWLDKSVFIERNGELFDGHSLREEDVKAFEQVVNGKYSPKLFKWVEQYSLTSDEKEVGQLVVISDQESTELEKMVIQHSIRVCTIQMYHEIQLTKSVWNKREEFLQEILKGNMSEEELSKKAQLFNYSLNEKKRVLTILLSDSTMNEQVFESIDLDERFMFEDFINLVIPSNQPVNHLFDYLQDKFPDLRFMIGIGREVDGLQNIKKSYKDAKRIAKFVELVYPFESKIAFYEEFEPVILFLQGSNQEELVEFCYHTIGEIIDYDEKNNAHLLTTLNSYLDNNGNLQKTATDLHLSIAGLRYRIERIESLCQQDLKTGNGIFKCQLAVQVYFAMKSIGNL